MCDWYQNTLHVWYQMKVNKHSLHPFINTTICDITNIIIVIILYTANCMDIRAYPGKYRCVQGPDSIWRCHLTSIGNPIVEISYTGKMTSLYWINPQFYIDGLVQDCSNSIANTMELLQSCTKPSIWYHCPKILTKTPHSYGVSIVSSKSYISFTIVITML